MRQLGRAKTQEIGVTRRAMWNVEPQVEQQRPFEQELIGVGDAEPVQQALEGIANIHHTLKKKPLRFEHLAEVIACYNPKNRHQRKATWAPDANPVRQVAQV